jgi:hypothetical protein
MPTLPNPYVYITICPNGAVKHTAHATFSEALISLIRRIKYKKWDFVFMDTGPFTATVRVRDENNKNRTYYIRRIRLEH